MTAPLLGECKDRIKIITPSDGAHYFFGYYDMRATNRDGKHLAHRVPFMDRFPEADNIAELGTLENGVFTKFAETTAWNFQQGAMLQFHPTEKNTVYYNACVDGHFSTVTHNIETGEKRYTDRATACISPDGRWGLAVNFGRIFAFRPGYGYAGFVDPYIDVYAPEEDGVFLTDMETGLSRQILSYASLSPASGFQDDDKVLINHITFNTTSDRFVMLVRNFRRPGCKKGWSTSMVIGDLYGNITAVLKNTYFSHYNWKNSDEIVAHCTVNGVTSIFLINVATGETTEWVIPYCKESAGNKDIHCNFSPDGRYMIGDGYPLDGYRTLVAYNVDTGSSKELFRAKTVIPPHSDLRCDLHARFINDGKEISFDTTQNDRREIAVLSTDVLDF